MRYRSRHADERGAVAVMVAIMLVLLMSMAAFALDTGNGWRTRRELITGTDAAALAAAETYAQNGNGCSGVPSTYVSANAPAASVTSCDLVTLGPGAAAVTVQAETPLHYTFAGIIGVDDRDVHSSTTAAYGQPLGVTGLRPLGLCNASAGYDQWIASDMTTPFTVTINYGEELARRLRRQRARQLGRAGLRRRRQLEQRHQGLDRERLPGPRRPRPGRSKATPGRSATACRARWTRWSPPARPSSCRSSTAPWEAAATRSSTSSAS